MSAVQLVVSGIVGGLAFAGGAIALARRPRALRTSIAEAPEGVLVELTGTIVDGPTIVAPLSDRACVHYLLRVDATRASIFAPPRARQTASLPFAIDDGTGRALIDPAGARIAVSPSAKLVSSRAPSARHAALLNQHGIPAVAGYIVREGALAIGDRIAVIGVAVREPDPDGATRATSYREAPTRLRLGAAGGKRLRVREAGPLRGAPW